MDSRGLPIDSPEWAIADAREREIELELAREIGDRGRARALLARHVVIEDDECSLSEGRWLIYGGAAALIWLAVLWWMGAL